MKPDLLPIGGAVAQAIPEYLHLAGIESRPLFRPLENSRSACIYTPHSPRVTTGTLLFDAGADIRNARELLGHLHVTSTQPHDKRRRSAPESAFHFVPIWCTAGADSDE